VLYTKLLYDFSLIVFEIAYKLVRDYKVNLKQFIYKIQLIIPFFIFLISCQFKAITVWLILLLAKNFSPDTQGLFFRALGVPNYGQYDR